jgi:hypothetical protein
MTTTIHLRHRHCHSRSLFVYSHHDGGTPTSPELGTFSFNDVVERLGLNGQFERWRFMQKLLEGEVLARDVEEVLLLSLSAYLMHGPTTTTTTGGDGSSERNIPNEKDDENGGNASPVLTSQMRDNIERVIDAISSISDGIGDSRFLHLLVSHPVDYESTDIDIDIDDDDYAYDNNGDGGGGGDDSSAMDVEKLSALSILEGIERLLPDRTEDEESHRSVWDVIIDLHGRESVRIMEEGLRVEMLMNDDDGDAGGIGSLMNIRSKRSLQWRTLCSIGRVLIHYDFLTRGVLREGAFTSTRGRRN